MRRFVVLLLALVAAAWLLSLILVVRAARTDAAAPADAIVVLGAAQYNGRPSPVLKARLDHAAALYGRGLARLVVVTGGTGAGDTTSEAAVARRYLLERGLPDSAVHAEDAGNSTVPSLRATARALAAREGGRRVLLVSDGFHMLRLAIIARRLALEPYGSPATESPIRGTGQIGYFLAESFKAPAAFVLTR